MSTFKTFDNVQIKDVDQGVVTAVISTFGVIDLDGDASVTSKTTFTDGAPVIVSSYGHKSWEGALPIGHGTIFTTDTEAIAELQFHLGTTHGKDAFGTVQELSKAGLQQWSYSLQDSVVVKGELNGQTANFIQSTKVAEVSPVLVGASINTRTLSVKADQDTPKGNKFSEHTDFALRGVKQLVEMAVDRLTVRAAEGKSISEQADAYDLLITELVPLKSAIDAATQEPPLSDEQREFLRFVASSKGLTS